MKKYLLFCFLKFKCDCHFENEQERMKYTLMILPPTPKNRSIYPADCATKEHQNLSLSLNFAHIRYLISACSMHYKIINPMKLFSGKQPLS